MLHLIALVFSISMLGGYIGYIYIYILGKVLEFLSFIFFIINCRKLKMTCV
jgi:hypothetical protein